MSEKNVLRNLPSVNILAEKLKEHDNKFPFNLCVEVARSVLEEVRKEVMADDSYRINEDEIIERALSLVKAKNLPSLRTVINGTGIILHTNLGRALLSKSAQQEVQNILKGYCNLEINLSTGKRGSRYSHLEDLLCKATGAEAALVVNNNAAAVFLILQALAKSKEVIVSRGQLVEIGGSFRVPEILEASGAKLIEVGTTNKTKVSDYEQAITENTAILLKVHTSNYRILGFTEEVSIEQLSELGQKYNIPVVEDIGSGFLIDLNNWGITDEPTVQQSVKGGADIVSFSGDKLLGGPQAGIIVGKKQYIDIIKKNPLNRALRIDKLTIAALEATLREYVLGENVLENIPTLNMLTVSKQVLKDKANKLAGLLKSKLGDLAEIEIVEDYSEAGGGSLPTTRLSTWVVKIKIVDFSLNVLTKKLRIGDPAIIGRVADEALFFDVRTIHEGDFNTIANRLYEELRQR
jgi:L-seryl-tRNA(Ser) seleniumtransferase